MGSITFMGKTYDNFKAVCQAHGIAPTTVRNRSKRRGVSLLDALTSVFTNGIAKREEVTVCGVEYPNFKAACRAHNILSQTMIARAKVKGITKTDALEQIIKENRKD